MRRLCFATIVAGALAAAAGCGYSGDGTSGIKGQCFVTISGGPPPSRYGGGAGGSSPYGHVILKVQTGAGDRTVAETTADAEGRFQIPSKPGAYRLVGIAPKPLPDDPSSAKPIPGQPTQPIEVEVKPGAFLNVTVNFRVLTPAPPPK